MNAWTRMGRKLMLAGCVVGLTATAGQAAMLYELDFQEGGSGTFANTGTVGGSATANPYTYNSSTSNVTYTTDTYNGSGYSANFPRFNYPTYRGPNLSLPDSTNRLRLQTGQDMTLAMWVKRQPQPAGSVRDQGLISTRVATSPQTGWNFFLRNVANTGSGAGSEDAELYFSNAVSNSSGTAVERNYRSDINGNTLRVKISEWTHVAVSIDQGTNIRFYINGVLAGGTQSFTAETARPGDVPINVGSAYQSAPTGTDSFGNNTPVYTTFGLLDNVQVYDTTLTGAEIAALAVVPEPALLGVAGLGGLMLLRRRRGKGL